MSYFPANGFNVGDIEISDSSRKESIINHDSRMRRMPGLVRKWLIRVALVFFDITYVYSCLFCYVIL